MVIVRSRPEPGCSNACSCANTPASSCSFSGFKRIFINCAHMPGPSPSDRRDFEELATMSGSSALRPRGCLQSDGATGSPTWRGRRTESRLWSRYQTHGRGHNSVVPRSGPLVTDCCSRGDVRDDLLDSAFRLGDKPWARFRVMRDDHGRLVECEAVGAVPGVVVNVEGTAKRPSTRMADHAPRGDHVHGGS